MIRLFSCCLLFSCLLTACREETELPGEVLPPEKMKRLVWDMVQADEYVNSYLLTDSSKPIKQHYADMYGKVFSVHKVDSAAFFSSYRYYQAHPDLHKRLLDSVYAYGSRQRDAGQKTSDSLIVQ